MRLIAAVVSAVTFGMNFCGVSATLFFNEGTKGKGSLRKTEIFEAQKMNTESPPASTESHQPAFRALHENGPKSISRTAHAQTGFVVEVTGSRAPQSFRSLTVGLVDDGVEFDVWISGDQEIQVGFDSLADDENQRTARFLTSLASETIFVNAVLMWNYHDIVRVAKDAWADWLENQRNEGQFIITAEVKKRIEFDCPRDYKKLTVLLPLANGDVHEPIWLCYSSSENETAVYLIYDQSNADHIDTVVSFLEEELSENVQFLNAMYQKSSKNISEAVLFSWNSFTQLRDDNTWTISIPVDSAEDHMDASLDERFERAYETLSRYTDTGRRLIPGDLVGSNVRRALLQAYYLQATMGHCNKDEPDAINAIHAIPLFEWIQWDRIRGMPKTNAKRRFIELVEETQKRWVW